MRKRVRMLKNLLRNPHTFGPDTFNRRHLLNGLFIILILTSLAVESLILLADCRCILSLPGVSGPGDVSLLTVFGVFLLGGLPFLKRSQRMPFWLAGMVLVLFIAALLSQADAPQDFSGGKNIVIWVVPIMLGAMIFDPAYGFLIAAAICARMVFFANPSGASISPASYDSIFIFFLVAFISWAGMSMAKRTTRDALHQTANLRAILDNISDGVLVLDRHGNYLSANPALLSMIPEDELREMSSRPFAKTLRWKRKVFSVTNTPVHGVGSVVIFKDQARCYEVESARDALLATVSHELRTPLTVVMNYLEMLLMLTNMEKIDAKKFSQHLTRAIENSQRLKQLVLNSLDQAQLQAGVFDLRNQRFNVRNLLEKSSQFLDNALKEKNLSYELDIAPDVPVEIIADPERLHQVLVNLIGNAIKFTNRGGIRVRAFMPTANSLSIEVQDSGPGIPEEQLPDIFEAFRRASNYAQRERQGAGLGLSIAKEIVIRMGGEIRVTSTPGIGSTFTVSLPLDEGFQGLQPG